MSYSHWEVAKAFAERDPFTKKGLPKRGSHVYIGLSGTVIYSYGKHFPMAYVDDEKKLFVINGDTYGVTTNRHQSEVRAAINSTNYNQVTIPYSVLYSAGIQNVLDIEVLDKGNEIEIHHCDTCERDLAESERYTHQEDMGVHPIGEKEQVAVTYGYRGRRRYQVYNKPQHRVWYRHLLAPSLIRHQNQYFLSGFDETAKAWNGGYFFSELPHKVKTIDEAFQSLRPKEVLRADAEGIKIKRQGDIFAIPSDITTRKLYKKGTKLPIHAKKILLDWNNEPFAEEETDEIADLNTVKYIANAYRPQLHGTNHYATEAVAVTERGKEVVYARGVLYHKPSWREADHRNISLGKKWYKVVKNTALRSWSVNARVD